MVRFMFMFLFMSKIMVMVMVIVMVMSMFMVICMVMKMVMVMVNVNCVHFSFLMDTRQVHVWLHFMDTLLMVQFSLIILSTLIRGS